MQSRLTGGMPAKLTQGPRAGYDLSRLGAGAARGANRKKKLEAAPWSGTWPAPGATLDLDFANNRGFVRGLGQGGVMDGITFTRASNATYVGEDGLLKGSGGAQGALGKNILTSPQNFTSWLGGSAVVPNQDTAPDGTNTASAISNVIPFVYVQTSVLGTYSVSVFGKANGTSNLRLGMMRSGNGVVVDFDLELGAAAYVQSGSVVSGGTPSIQSIGNGWYRCLIENLSFNDNANFIITTSGAAASIYIWGAQLELGSTATEYFPTNINVPRFDWAGTANAQRNILAHTETPYLYSLNAVTNAGAYAGAMPTGASAATQVRETATTAPHYFRLGGPNFVAVATGLLTFTIRVLPQGRTRVQVLPERVGASEWAGSTFNLSTNTATNTITAGGQTLISSGVTDDTGGWKIVRVTYRPTASITGLLFGLLDDAVSGASPVPSYAGDAAKGIAITGLQLEAGEVSTDYQAVAQPTTNTPLRPTATCNGLLIEESRTNRLLWCRDATQTQWIKTDITAAKDQTGIDGVANAASSLTATADGGTCIQTITLASDSRTGSVYLKRLTGTGTVQVSLDGTTWSTVDLSDTEWRRIVLSGTVTNPVVGIRLAVSGDAVAMDFGQVEDGAFATSPILTTGASVTRAVDAASISGSNFNGWITQGKGTLLATFLDTPSRNVYAGISNGSSGSYIRWLKQSSTSIRFDNAASGDLSDAIATESIPAPGGFNTAAASWQNYNTALSVGGQSSRRDTAIRSRLVGTDFSIFRIGADYNGSSPATSCIKRIAYIPQRVSDSALQALSGQAT